MCHPESRRVRNLVLMELFYQNGSIRFQGVMVFNINLATNLRELSRIFYPFRDNSCNSLQFLK